MTDVVAEVTLEEEWTNAFYGWKEMKVSVVLTNKGEEEACNIRVKFNPPKPVVLHSWNLELNGEDWGLPDWKNPSSIAGGSSYTGAGFNVVSEAVPSFQVDYTIC